MSMLNSLLSAGLLSGLTLDVSGPPFDFSILFHIFLVNFSWHPPPQAVLKSSSLSCVNKNRNRPRFIIRVPSDV